MKPGHPRDASLSYSKVGISRSLREKSRKSLERVLIEESKGYLLGSPVNLPFGIVFPLGRKDSRFSDLQIEGVGTKTLLAELSGNYGTVGIDGVAMAANDVLRSGAAPLLISDAIHIGKTSSAKKLNELIRGIRTGARLAECVIASGETGTVSEILHEELSGESPPFDLFVSCLGLAQESELIRGKMSVGDIVIGLKSSGIHSNGLTLARKVLLKQWGGKFDFWEKPSPLQRPLIEELLEPTRIYSRDMALVRKDYQIKAAVHITGDGFAKFHRLLDWQKRTAAASGGSRASGIKFLIERKRPEIFDLIDKTAKAIRTPISEEEMLKTFNMGYGFALVVSPEVAESILETLNKVGTADCIGRVTDDGEISVKFEGSNRRLVI